MTIVDTESIAFQPEPIMTTCTRWYVDTAGGVDPGEVRIIDRSA
jgi:hypothetical protein